MYSHLPQHALVWYAAALAFLFAGCGSGSEFYRQVEQNVAEKNYTSAIADVQKNRDWYGDKNTVLYNLDLGLLYHYAGESDSSISYFFNAEKQIEDLYTKSVSQQALSFILNDNILPYEGEDFEKVLINLFLALNYAEKGMTDDALVEARKVDLKFRDYTRRYDGKNCYQDDAFIRYVMGALYEHGGEINDAFISYRKAYEAYAMYEKQYGTRPPSFLLDDLVRTATKLSFTDEAETYKALGGTLDSAGGRQQGSVLVIVYSGRGPIKIEDHPSVTIADSSGTLHTFQIALPKFTPRVLFPKSYEISAIRKNDTTRATAEVAENITAIANKTLSDRLTLIYLKSGGRAVLKFLAAEKMKSAMKKGDNGPVANILGSLAVDLAIGATEQADVRTWRTLPAEIHLARLNLAPGTYNIMVGSPGSSQPRQVTVPVTPRQTKFVIVDDVR